MDDEISTLVQQLVSAEDVADIEHMLTYVQLWQRSDIDLVLTRELQQTLQQGDLSHAQELLAARSFLKQCHLKGDISVPGGPLALPLRDHTPLRRLMKLPYDRASLPRRAELALEALSGVRAGTEPDLYAELHREVGDCLARSEGADRGEKIEKALQSYQTALRIWNKPPFVKSPKWAQTLHAKAATYRRRVLGSRSENLEKAIRLYEQALTVRTRTRAQKEWAETQHDLGVCWLEMRTGDRQVVVERAIHHFHNALEIRTRKGMPQQWASTTHELSSALLEVSGRGKADAIEDALKLCQGVQKIFTKVEMPVDWARSQIAAGIAYTVRLQDDRTENLTQAIGCLNQALTVLSPESAPLDWGKAQYQLSIAYRHNPTSDRRSNLRQAANHGQQASQIFALFAYPCEWAHSLTTLGNIYCQPETPGDRAENLEKAITCYSDALKIRTERSDPQGWATLQNNLGNAYADRIRGKRTQNQERAIECYNQATKVRTCQSVPERWAETMNNLGAIYSERLKGSPGRNRKKAISYLRQALEIHQPDTFPLDARRAASNLAQLLFSQRRWAEAAEAYQTAIQSGENLLEAAYTDTGRQVETVEISRLYADAAYCSLKLGSPIVALEQLERGKARLLAEALILSGQDIAELPAVQRERIQQARAVVRQYQTEQQLAEDSYSLTQPDINPKLAEAYKTLRDVVKNIQASTPGFVPTGLAFEKIAELVEPGSALIAPLVTRQGGVAFIIRHDAIEPDVLDLENFDAQTLASMFDRYLTAYGQEKTWLASLSVISDELWQNLLDSIVANLGPEICRVLLVPQGGLQLFPLHAAQSPAGDYILDRYIIHYIPSAFALSEATTRAHQSKCQEKTFFGVSNPTQDLKFAQAEGEAVASFFDQRHATILSERTARKEIVLAHLEDKTYIHFACHGRHDWQDAFSTALTLADGERLTLTEIIRLVELSSTRLVTLSACETGLTDLKKAPDEFLGLPAGFLQAGAPAVISTLWAVDDLSTMLLMEQFYTLHLQEGAEIAEALRQAQLWLRDVTAGELAERFTEERLALLAGTRMPSEVVSQQFRRFNAMEPEKQPFEHPYYWAAFTFSGA